MADADNIYPLQPREARGGLGLDEALAFRRRFALISAKPREAARKLQRYPIFALVLACVPHCNATPFSRKRCFVVPKRIGPPTDAVDFLLLQLAWGR